MQTTIKLSVIWLLLLISILIFSNHLLTGSGAEGQTTSLAAPPEVTASDNAYSTKVGISWDTVRGATLYRVFRNTTSNSTTATAVGTTPEGTFFDTTGAAGQTFFYWVRAENGSIVSPLSTADQGVRANGAINGPVPPLNPPPQPAGNLVTATKAYLGKTLFWDEQLSSTRTVACGTRAANPRQPAWAAATTPVRRSATNSGTQSAAWTASAKSASSVTRMSTSQPAVSTPGRGTMTVAPWTW